MLLHELDRLFSDVKRPDPIELGSHGSEEWASTLRHLAAKTWRNVTVEDFDSQDGLLGTVNVLSARGILYFLPGLLRLTLNSREEGIRYLIASALLNVFTHPDLSKASREQVAVLSSLSGSQRDFLIRFFEEKQRELPTICPVILQAAITSLKAGEPLPYSQEQVRFWASHFSSTRLMH